MRSLYLSIGILFILLNVNNCLTRKKTRGKTYGSRKPASSLSKTSVPGKPGQLFYRGGRHPIQLNQTDEYEVYAANYTMFPDVLFYTRPSTDRDLEEFLPACINTTMEADINRERLSNLRSNGEVYMRVTTHIIEFLCIENYYKAPNRAYLPAGGLWEVLTAIIISFALKWLS